MINNFDSNTPTPRPDKSDEINLREVADALVRKWRWMAAGSFIGLLIAGLQLSRSKPVYQGEFQIVLSGQESGGASLLSKSPGFAATAGIFLQGGAESIATELQILNSPSVLLPVFEAVRAKKPPEVANGMRFRSWAKSAITAEEEKGTYVLNVEFRDTDKQIVLPITRMISDVYQSYSNRGRSRELNNAIKYLKTQISKVKPQSKASFRKALNFGQTNSLGILDGLPLAGNVVGAGVAQVSGGRVAVSGGNLELARTTAQQKVVSLEVQIKAAQEAGVGSIYFASQLGSLNDKSSTFDQLTRIETRLAELRSRFKSNDPFIKKLELERETLINYINEQTIALLKGELELVRANLKSLERPKEVVNRHRELTQEALRDEATLVTLQNQLNQYELEQARDSNPWELISTPTLLESPVSPHRKRILGLGLLGGLILGGSGALISDRRSGRVFSKNELQRELPFPLLKCLPNHSNIQEFYSWVAPIQLLADGPLAGNGSVALIPIGSIAADDLDAFQTSLREALGVNRELLISRDLLATRACSTQLLVTAPGAAKREDLRQLREQLALQGTNVAGWIFIDNNLED